MVFKDKIYILCFISYTHFIMYSVRSAEALLHPMTGKYESDISLLVATQDSEGGSGAESER